MNLKNLGKNWLSVVLSACMIICMIILQDVSVDISNAKSIWIRNQQF